MDDFERPTPNSARAKRAYSTGPNKLIEVVERAVEGLPRWTLESSRDGELHAIRRTRLFRFRDDVTVRIVEQANGSEARFESASRVGKVDLGRSPRNLEELLDAINRELG
ncbi:MAG TPA: DUF1499 domain-containing protein [Rubrobacteraceae bacterium]|nr:DUF1499 domain-containing protein [Rubrobacteraceae bacterium]